MQPYAPASPELTKAALTRLERALDEENAALSSSGPRNLSEFNRIKTQCLLELQRPASLSGAHGDISAHLQAIQQKLELNRWLLHLHLEAAKEIASVIVSAIRDAESDGTYSRISSAGKVF